MTGSDEKWLESLASRATADSLQPEQATLREALFEYARRDDLTSAQKDALFHRVVEQAAPRRDKRSWYLPAAAAASVALVGLGVVIKLSIPPLPDESPNFWDYPRYRDLPTGPESETPVLTITERKLKRFLVDHDLPYRLVHADGEVRAEVYVGTDPAAEVLSFFAERRVRPNAYGWIHFDVAD